MSYYLSLSTKLGVFGNYLEIDDYSVYAHFTDGTSGVIVVNPLSCYQAKTENSIYIYGTTCVPDCSVYNQVLINGMCTACVLPEIFNPVPKLCQNCTTISSGVNNYLNNGSVCVVSCSSQFKISDVDLICSQCIAPTFYNIETDTCVNPCPTYLVPNTTNRNCDNCNTLSLGFSYNGICNAVAGCPALYTLDNPARNGCATCLSLGLYYDGDVAMGCVATCPAYLIPNTGNGNCDNCKTISSSYSYNDACVAGAACPVLSTLINANRNGCKSCISLAKFYDEETKTCVATCPEYLIPNQITRNCDNCKLLNLGYSILTSCVSGSSCPPGLKLVNTSRNGCLACPGTQVLQSGECVNSCNPGYIEDTNRACVTCPSNLPYYLGNQCVSSCLYMGFDVATKICYNCKSVSKFWFAGQCVDSIPLGTALKVEEFAAYAICSQMDPAQYKYQGVCVKDCPINTFRFPAKLECSTSNCRDYNAFFYNGVCVNPCPVSTSVDQITNKCVSSVQIFGNFIILINKYYNIIII